MKTTKLHHVSTELIPLKINITAKVPHLSWTLHIRVIPPNYNPNLWDVIFHTFVPQSISQTPRRKLFKFGPNIRFDSKMNWLDFGGKCSINFHPLLMNSCSYYDKLCCRVEHVCEGLFQAILSFRWLNHVTKLFISPYVYSESEVDESWRTSDFKRFRFRSQRCCCYKWEFPEYEIMFSSVVQVTASELSTCNFLFFLITTFRLELKVHVSW